MTDINKKKTYIIAKSIHSTLRLEYKISKMSLYISKNRTSYNLWSGECHPTASIHSIKNVLDYSQYNLLFISVQEQNFIIYNIVITDIREVFITAFVHTLLTSS